MFDQLNNPQFKVHECLMGQNQVAFLWDFTFAMRRWNTTPQSFSGVSWLTFDEQFLVIKHHDYWDPAAGIYEHLPILGPIMRGLKSRA
jgi:steroid delta-isomerase